MMATLNPSWAEMAWRSLRLDLRSSTIPGVADQLPAHEILRSPESHCDGPALVEACERSLIGLPPFLPVRSVAHFSPFSPSSSPLSQRQTSALLRKSFRPWDILNERAISNIDHGPSLGGGEIVRAEIYH
jgi:hypothetical protein